MRRFGGIVAVNGVSFRIERGGLIGLIGPNGSGKTTLINLLSGALAPDEGVIRLDGRDMHGGPPHAFAQHGIGRTFQVPRLFRRMTVMENLLVPALTLPRSDWRTARRRVEEVLAFFGLSALAGAQARTLSGGQQKLLELGRALSSLLAGIPSSSWLSRTGMPRLLTRGERRRGDRLLGYSVAGFISEPWPASNRNDGRHQLGIRGRLASESADARLFRKGRGKEAKLCHMGHLLMENRSGLIIDALLTPASGTAEREAAEAMLGRQAGRHRATLGADKGYDAASFVAALRTLNVTPHIAQNTTRRSAIDRRTTRHPGYATSQRVRKRIEEAFGWIKTVGGLRKTRHRGTARLAGCSR